MWLLAIVLVVCVLLGAGLYLYDYVYGHVPSAHRHVPEGTNIALRADAVKILTFEPVRRHLWPLLLDSDGESDEDRGRRRKRITEVSGVDIPLDFREIVVASIDGRSWVAIVAGQLEPGRFISGVHQVLTEEGIDSWKPEGGLLIHDYGPALGQADDGTIVLGTSAEITRASLPASDEEPTLPLPTEGALSFWVDAKAYSGALRLLPTALAGTGSLRKVEQLAGELTLNSEPQLQIRLVPREGLTTNKLADELDSSLTKLRIATSLLRHDLFGGKQALQDATVQQGRGIVHLSAPWPYEALDKALERLADILRTTKRFGSRT